MLRTYVKSVIFVMLVLLTGLFTGCGFKSSQDASSQPSFGVIEMQKVIENHPKYDALQQLVKQANTMAAEIEALKGQAVQPAKVPVTFDKIAGLHDAAEKEFNAKMAAKESELNTQLQASYNELRHQMDTEMDVYVKELDKTYQPQLFNIQLKLKTMQMTKEQTEAAQAEMNGIEKERMTKIEAKKQELAKKMNEIMSGKQAETKAQMNAYGKQLNTSIGSKLAAEKSQMANLQVPVPLSSTGRSDKEQQLALKKQEITVLQEAIINDIRDKAGKVAAEKGLEVVFKDTRVNVNAIDITDAVIAEIKK